MSTRPPNFTIPQAPPFHSPMFPGLGPLAQPWVMWFARMAAAAGSTDADVIAAFGDAGDVAAVNDLAREFAQQSVPVDSAAAIADLQRELAQQPIPRDLGPIVDALDRLIALIPVASSVEGQIRDIQTELALMPVYPAAGVSGSGSEVYQITQVITTDVSIADPGGLVDVGQEVEYQLTQDSTGGWVVSWDTEFKGVSPLTVGRVANFWNVVRFRKLASGMYARLFATGDVDLS